MQPHEYDVPSSPSEDELDSLEPAPAPGAQTKSYAAAAVEPPPQAVDGEVKGKLYASAVVKPQGRRRRGENGGKESGYDGGNEGGSGRESAHEEDEMRSASPQKTGERSTSNGDHEIRGKEKREKESLVSGDYASNRR
jgi:type IV secretory pathway VirB10-like protein